MMVMLMMTGGDYDDAAYGVDDDGNDHDGDYDEMTMMMLRTRKMRRSRMRKALDSWFASDVQPHVLI